MIASSRVLIVGMCVSYAVYGETAYGYGEVGPLAKVAMGIQIMESPVKGVLARVMAVQEKNPAAGNLWKLTKLLNNRVWNITDPESLWGVGITTIVAVIIWKLWHNDDKKNPPSGGVGLLDSCSDNRMSGDFRGSSNDSGNEDHGRGPHSFFRPRYRDSVFDSLSFQYLWNVGRRAVLRFTQICARMMPARLVYR